LERRYIWMSVRMRVLELEAGGREAAPGKGAPSMSTIAHEVEHTNLGGGTQYEMSTEEGSRGERSGTVLRR
jgi:hypothetical protein